MLGDICWYISVHWVIKQQFSSRHQMAFLVLYNLRKCFRKNMATKNSKMNLLSRKAVVLRFSVKKMFLEISQNSQENTCVRTLFLNKVVGLRPPTLLNERLRHRCFLRNFVKFLRTCFLQSTTGWLLLEYLLLPSTLDRLDRKESSKSLSEITKQRRFPFF